MKVSAGKILAVEVGSPGSLASIPACHFAPSVSLQGKGRTAGRADFQCPRSSGFLFRKIGLLLAVSFLLFATGCSRQAKLERHLARGQQYSKTEQYQKAEIELLNAVRLDPANIVALRELGFVYYQQGRWLRGYAFLQKSAELAPDNQEVRLRLASILMAVRDLNGARTNAQLVLARDPANEEALMLLAETAVTTNEIAAARNQLEKSRREAENKPGFQLAIGILELRQGRTNEAAAAFQRALSIDPKSSPAHLALGNLAALSLDDAQAELHFRKVAELAPPRSPRRLQFSDFKLRTGDSAAAKADLEAVARQVPDYVPVYSRLGEIALNERQFDQASSLAKKILGLDPGNFDGLLLSARVRVGQGDARAALVEFERLAAAYPRIPQVHYHVAVASLLNENPVGARKALQQALALDPKNADATLLLAEINLRQNESMAALTSLKQLVREHPRIFQAHLALARAYRSVNQPAAAAEAYETMTKTFPRSPQPHFAWGQLLVAEGKRDVARQKFERVVELSPDFFPAIEELVNLDIAGGDYPAAEKRIKAAIERQPRAPGLHVIASKIYSAQKNVQASEQALARAITLDPNHEGANLALARLYADSNRPQVAVEKLSELVARNTNNVGARLQLAMLHHQSGNYAAARDSYEKILLIDSRFFPALNNLASLYSENLVDLKRAYALARSARELRPDDPIVADTLGWILFKQGNYSGALPLLQQSADELTKSAEIQFHLGMTHYMLGNQQAARGALEKSLATGQEFSGKAEAQAKLALLSGSSGEPLNIASLEKQLAANPRDPLILSQLAGAYEKAGSFDKAAATYNTAIQANPRNVPAMLKAAQLYAGPLRDTARALQLARNARSLAPNDREVAQVLGALAFASGDYKWSLSLLEEGARGVTNQPQLLHNLAWARYSDGRITDAVAVMKQALAAGASFANESDARRFIELNTMALQPDTANPASIQAALQQDARYVPALLASAVLQQRSAGASVAREHYETILKRFPDFTPAHKGLSILLSQSAPTSDAALQYATRAREALPGDPEVARALGMIAFHRKDYARAAQLLKECSTALPNDAETYYYLGMAHFQLKQSALSRSALERAVSLSPQAGFVAEARKALSQLN